MDGSCRLRGLTGAQRFARFCCHGAADGLYLSDYVKAPAQYEHVTETQGGHLE